MWFAYALRSGSDGGFYVGMTSDIERRVKEHNSGSNRSTRSRVPFTLFYSEQCASPREAREREKYLKSGQGRDFLKLQASKPFVKSVVRAGVTQG